MGVSSFCSGRGPKKSVPSRLQRVWSLASDDLKAAPLAAKLMKSYALLAEPWLFFYQKWGSYSWFPFMEIYGLMDLNITQGKRFLEIFRWISCWLPQFCKPSSSREFGDFFHGETMTVTYFTSPTGGPLPLPAVKG